MLLSLHINQYTELNYYYPLFSLYSILAGSKKSIIIIIIIIIIVVQHINKQN